MNFFTLAEAADITGGRILSGDPAQTIGPLSTDSRSITPGQTFVALVGDRFKGDDFVDAAVGLGASAVIAAEWAPSDAEGAPALLRVPDALWALGDIAGAWRRKLGTKLVAVSGSSGKTTTKEMLAHICSQQFSTLATRGNLNNLIGLPMMLLELRPEHQVAVIETGMNVPGELARLTEICSPDLAIITNIGNAHIGNFDGVDGLTLAEGEIAATMSAGGLLLINGDCPGIKHLNEMQPIRNRCFSFGYTEGVDLRIENVRPLGSQGYTFELVHGTERVPVELGLFGRYQVHNAAAACAAALNLGIALQDAAKSLLSFSPPKLRSRTEVLDGVLLVEDCYNSSPDAAGKALLSLRDLGTAQRRFALLGDMNELGAESEALHREVGRKAAEAGLERLFTVGEKGRWILDEAQSHGVSGESFANGNDAAEHLARTLRAGDAVLVKASRTVKLEEAVATLRRLRTQPQL